MLKVEEGEREVRCGHHRGEAFSGEWDVVEGDVGVEMGGIGDWVWLEGFSGVEVWFIGLGGSHKEHGKIFALEHAVGALGIVVGFFEEGKGVAF